MTQANEQTYLQEAAQLNRDAAAQAADGNAVEARKLFKDALVLVNSNSATGNSECCCSNEAPEQEEEGVEHRRGVSSWPVILSEKKEPFFIYSHVFLFEPTSDSASSCEVDHNFYCTALIFNIALTYHQEAKLSTSKSHADKCYRLAERMYQKSMDIAQLHMDEDPDMGVLELVSRNNQASIVLQKYCSKCEDMSRSMSRMYRLSYTLLLSEKRLPQLDEAVIQKILGNAMTPRAFGAPSA